MRNEYQILWVDDNHSTVRGDVRNIKSFLADHGVELMVRQVSVTADNFPTEDKDFAAVVADPDLDMVFVDYNMPELGDVIISHIRKNLQHYHLPILFYTGDNDPHKILPKLFIDSLLADESFLNVSDGIYFCDRDHIFDKAKMILSSLLAKDHKPQRGRGLLMDKVSEIDAKIISATERLWQSVPEGKQKSVSDHVLKKIKGRMSRANKLFSDMENKSYGEIIPYLLSNPRAIDTHFRSEMLREMLRYISDKSGNGETLSQFYNTTAGANAETKCLVDLRNDYAHKTGDEINASHGTEKCKYIRVETRRHLQNVKELLGEA